MSPSSTSYNRRPNSGGEPATNLTFASDFDDWNYNYKLKDGRLISTNVYSGGQGNPQSPPNASGSIKSLVTPSPNPNPPTIQAHILPSKVPEIQSEKQEISIRYDPEPITQVVDAQNDNDFLTNLQSDDVSAFDEQSFISATRHNDLRLKLWREQTALESRVPSSQPTPKPKRKKDVSELATIEKVLREMYPRDNPTEDSSPAASVTQESGMRKEMSIDGSMDNIRLCSQDGGNYYLFSRQTISLSKSFVTIMENDGFDGEIILTEDPETLQLLGAWMSRDLDFEITIGILLSAKQTNA